MEYVQLIRNFLFIFSAAQIKRLLPGSKMAKWWKYYYHELSRSGRHDARQAAFFIALFSSMGRLSKIDGRVTEREIAKAQAIMANMRLGTDQKRLAIGLFNEGKQPEFDLDAVLVRYRHICRHELALSQLFLEILLQMALADGDINVPEMKLLTRIRWRLGYSLSRFKKLEIRVRSDEKLRQLEGLRTPDSSMLLEEAFEVLGVSPGASQGEITQAYRRLLSSHHPDKLASKNLPAEILAMATEKTRDIKKAYGLISQTWKAK